MDKIPILWVDDEIDLLKPHIIFLQEKGYDVSSVNNGHDALDILKTKPFDIIFLDEQMPGLSGIETLLRIKESFPSLPVVMITKSEEESIMEDAIGSNIADYLIKPVNPNQILLCLKKNLENRKLVSEKTTHQYQQEFRNIGMEISNRLNFSEWVEVYKKITYWELKLSQSTDDGMNQVLKMQKDEANQVFCKFIERNYLDWVNGKGQDRPVQSHNVIKEKVFPLMQDNKPTFVILIDNLRFDQWKVLQPILEDYFRVEKEEVYYSILPTVTQFARNSLFAGLLPTEIEKKYPKYWVNEDEEGPKNNFESELMGELLKRYGRGDVKYSYYRVLNQSYGKK
ncbi:MAG: response regulator, partial [Bacteroidales bacterium]